MEYTKREIKDLAIVTFILAIVFGLNDGRDAFEIGYWLTNFLKILVICGISIFLYDFAHDFAARKYGFFSEHRIWGIKRFSLSGKERFPRSIRLFGKEFKVRAFPLGIFIAIFLALFSNGHIYFAAVSSYRLMIRKSHRLGKKFVEVTDFEDAKIALAGPIMCIFIAIFFNIFNSAGTFDDVILINSLIAVYHMLPLPGLDGMKVYAGSKPLFVFAFLFIIGAAILMSYLSTFAALLLTILLAALFMMIYLYRSFYK